MDSLPQRHHYNSAAGNRMTLTAAQSRGTPEILRIPDTVRSRYGAFIERCRTGQDEFRLTPRSEASPYALCFAIFGAHLLQRKHTLASSCEKWDGLLRRNLDELETQKADNIRHRDKAYLQLLTFTLSALSILGTLTRNPLERHVLSVISASHNVDAELRAAGSLKGRPRSGNHAMFLAILMLHARANLGHDTNAGLQCWIEQHISGMNRFGFWGNDRSMSHLQFQNGYHQYEILEFLDADDVPWDRAADAVAALADPDGHFAPYPGGGGCYDYDAVFILTGTPKTSLRHASLLQQTARSIMAAQNADGGFCESHHIRPRSLENLKHFAAHVLAGRGRARMERLRQALTLLRPKHNRIHTHWSRYSREWGESDLWDSWFRMLTLARIECALHPERAADWGFINFPGIGYHPSLQAGVPPKLAWA
jgi:hypothetical protein